MKRGRKKGFKHTEKTKTKMSLAQLGKPKPWMRGPNHPCWKGGKPHKRELSKVYSREYREKHPEWKKEDNKKNRRKQAILIRRWNKEHPEILECYAIFKKALRKGLIKRMPCIVPGCGDPNTHGHHEDHSKPLEVDWLCPKHHKWVENNIIDLGAILKKKETAQV